MRKDDEDVLEIAMYAKKLGFNSKTFLVTGASGMIGQNLVKSLRKITDDSNIIVIGKDLEELSNVFKDTKLNFSTFENLDSIKRNIDYVIHLASPTNSNYLSNCPVETIDFIYKSTKQLLDFSLSHKSSMLYISSMEVYGYVDKDSKITENELGFIDLFNVRNISLLNDS